MEERREIQTAAKFMPDRHDGGALTGGPDAEERQLLMRLEELRLRLQEPTVPRQAEALETLFSMAWVQQGRPRLLIACTLCGYAPQRAFEIPPPAGPTRFCSHLERAQPAEDLLSPPGIGELKGNGLSDRMSSALISTLTHALDVLKAELRASVPDAPHIRAEAEVCLSMLLLARRMRCEQIVEPCLRLLQIFSPETARVHGPQARLTARLRESAGQTLGALSPDSLFAFWYALGSPDMYVRRNLLPTLDYLTDARAVPYLIRLLERRRQWADGDVVGWFVVRAMEHIGDRSVLPALRRIAAEGAAPLQGAQASAGDERFPVSLELAREAERIIRSIEGRKNRLESASLLRPAHLSTSDLLRPAADALDATDLLDREELLRPEETS